MDQAYKFLKKLDSKKRIILESILKKLYNKDFVNLDIKKLKSVENLFRVRKVDIRIIYTIARNNEIQVLRIEFRGDNTY